MADDQVINENKLQELHSEIHNQNIKVSDLEEKVFNQQETIDYLVKVLQNVGTNPFQK